MKPWNLSPTQNLRPGHVYVLNSATEPTIFYRNKDSSYQARRTAALMSNAPVLLSIALAAKETLPQGLKTQLETILREVVGG